MSCHIQWIDNDVHIDFDDKVTFTEMSKHSDAVYWDLNWIPIKKSHTQHLCEHGILSIMIHQSFYKYQSLTIFSG